MTRSRENQRLRELFALHTAPVTITTIHKKMDSGIKRKAQP
jgi:hypothetical protein